MRKFLVAAAIAALPVAAQAQLTGGVTGAVGATTGAVGAGATVGADTAVVDDTVGKTRDAADATARSAAKDADETGRDAAAARTPMVNGGASVHVARETRCYDGTNYYDPYYGNGYYYCRTSGPGASAKIKVQPRR